MPHRRAVTLLTKLARALEQHIEHIKNGDDSLGTSDLGDRPGPSLPASVVEASNCLRQLEMETAADRLERDYEHTSRPLLDAWYCSPLCQLGPKMYGLAKKHLGAPRRVKDPAKARSAQEQRMKEFVRRASSLRNWMVQLRDDIASDWNEADTGAGDDGTKRKPGRPKGSPGSDALGRFAATEAKKLRRDGIDRIPVKALIVSFHQQSGRSIKAEAMRSQIRRALDALP